MYKSNTYLKINYVYDKEIKIIIILFYFILFYFILFYFTLFYFILFYTQSIIKFHIYNI